MRQKQSRLELDGESGAVLPFFAIMLVVLLGFAAFAIDFGFAYMRQAQLQNVADAEALACARDYANCQSGGDQYPLTNAYGFTIATTKGVACPNPSTQQNCVQATASTNWNTFFLPLFGINTLNLSKTAIAGKKLLSDAVVIRSTVDLNGGTILGVSSGSVAIGGALRAVGGSLIKLATAGSTTTVYNNASVNCSNCQPPPQSTGLSLPTPPAYTPPTPPSVMTYASGCSLPSGTYNSSINLTGCGTQVNMSGIYYFNNGFTNNGITLAGTGVTIIVGVDKNFDLSGTVNLNSSNGASTCGTAGGGMLIYQPISLTGTTYTLGGAGSNTNISLTGRTQLPNTNFLIKGTSASFAISGALYANSLDLRGNLNASASPDPCQNLNIGSGNTILVK
ncbi:TadE/TadG family type IV pilus assembly protein [Polynucleobacter sp. AP-Nino-20-G2]|uniref:TadE/TadG family type IV pilus assembly protein n=1 Tax=Polynucleobacter sp. AP-Nino-20-G2 TaxID=2576917 RepID=UPI001BFE0CB8|nr:TadE/TadG family type IV pilus assembly protein [Polynucleobacter sp. AP-Nino-20-G2]QWE17087.1 hypothetical protein FD960_02365 [Polynucleobacter sp. AP-Nino-20-G2]